MSSSIRCKTMETPPPWQRVRTQSKGLCLAAARAIAPGAEVRVYVSAIR